MRLSKQKIKLYPQEIVVIGGTLLCKRHKNVETQTVKKNLKKKTNFFYAFFLG